MNKALPPSNCFSELNCFQNKMYCKLLRSCTLLVLSLISFTTLAQTCNVKDFLYLNDPQDYNTQGFVHKLKIGAGGTLSEVANGLGNTPWYPAGGGLGSPHGLGQDLNGNLYIGANSSTGPIAKIKCDGTLVNLNFINDAGFNIVSKDGYLYVNSVNDNHISRYLLCDGSPQGWVTLNGVSSQFDWGLSISTNGTIYATSGIDPAFSSANGVKAIYRFTPTDADFVNHTDYLPLVSANNLPPGAAQENLSIPSGGVWLWGITADNAGNMYVIAEDPWFNHTDTDYTGYTWILKYAPNGTLLASASQKQTSTPITGYKGGRGIVYYPSLNVLYVAAGQNGDCVAMINPSNLSYIGAAAGNIPGQNPKTLRIASEACPVAASTVVDTTLCNLKVGDKLFLSQLIGKCNAPICGGNWTADPSNVGMTFNQCDLSFTVNNLSGCGKFTLSNVGGDCGNFTIEANIAMVNIEAPVIVGNQTICTNTNPTAITVGTPASGSGTITYQWQQSTTSCTSGFSNIVGAVNSTYTPPNTSQTTYYHVIASTGAGCTPTPKMCSDTSNCVTVTVLPKPIAGTDQAPTCVGNTAITTATLAATAVSGGAWTQVATNPAGAVITTPTSATSGITGLVPGVYEFIWATLATCSDTVKITIPNCTCTLSLTATPGTCVQATNNYSISGNLTFVHPPTTGTLTVSVGAITQVFNAPFTSTQAYTLNGLTSDGASHTVLAAFNTSPACSGIVNYTAPANCLCPTNNCGTVTVLKN